MKTTISIKEYFEKSNAQGYNETAVEKENANILIPRVNIMLQDFIADTGHNQDIIISSGHRTAEYNKIIGGSEKSLHKVGKAVDLMNCKIAEWYILKGFSYWQKIKLSVEHFSATKGRNQGWSHFDLLARKDQRYEQATELVYRVFYP